MKSDKRFYELRTYFAAPGMLERLLSRFEDHTLHFFAKHNMQVVGLWLPVDNPENKLVYILSFADEEACKKSWEDFKADAEWLAIKGESVRDGELVVSVESTFMYSPDFVSAHLIGGIYKATIPSDRRI
jgi:hypothetical protein